MFLFCFFFKQKTAYEMRISDWSSDGCSSDLNARCPPYSDRRAHDRWPEARRRLRTADIRTVRPAGVGGMTYMSSEELTARLVECGYCIVPDVLPTATIDAFNADLDPVFAATPFGQGRFYGYRTKRLGGLLKRSAHAETLALEPTTLGAVQARSEEHTSELQSLMRTSYAVF